MAEFRYLPAEELRDGPVSNRKCTDLACGLVLGGFLAAFFAVGAVGFSRGDPTLLLFPMDSAGNQCGRGQTKDYSYLYYPLAAIYANFTEARVCMKECPKGDSNLECYNNERVQCVGKEFYIQELKSFVDPYESNMLWKRFCVPEDNRYFFNAVINAVDETGFSGWTADVLRCWTAICIILGVACGLSIIYLVLIRLCAEIITWLSLVFTAVIIVVFGIYIDKAADENFSSKSDQSTYNALKTFAIVIYVSVVVFFIAVVYLFRRIHLAIAVMKSAAIFLNDVPGVVFVPLVMFGVAFAVFVYWLLALAFIYSTGTVESSGKINWDYTTRNSFYFEFVGILWVSALKVAITQFIVASTVCFWYFSRESSSFAIIFKSTYYAFRYHLGTLALGSFLLSFLKLLKFTLWYIKHNIHSQDYQKSPFFRLLCCCVECCVLCFTNFIEFIDKQAYIQTALSGVGFYQGAKNAFNLFLHNAGRFAALGAIGDTFKVLGKVFITVVSTYSGFVLVSYYSPYKDRIQSPIAPTVVFAVVSYSVAGIFMSVLELACDTILQSFLIDEQIHKTAFFAPEPLKDFVSEHREVTHKTHCCGCL
jgi:hypothetical protein